MYAYFMSSVKANYMNLYVPKDNRSMDDICDMSMFTYQKQQLFVKRWFDSGKKKLLLFHGLGSGKTCSSILAIESLKSRVDNVYVITPASLKENYKKELLGQCGNYKSVPSNIKIMSHNGFAKSLPDLKNSLVVIDEVQNIVSSSGSTYKTYFNELVTKNPKNLHVVLLSATPMFDQPHEIALTMNLLNLPKPLPVLKFYTEFLAKNQTLKNVPKFFESIKGYVSAFKGISPNAYAKRTDTTLLCNMSAHQLGSYTKSVQGLTMNNVAFSQAFLSGPRVSSNIVYESGGFGTAYRPKDATLAKQLNITNLKKLSSKFYKCFTMIAKASGPVFVYSNFVSAGGINDFALVLKVNGYSEVNALKRQVSSPKKRFGVFRTGKDEENTALVNLFNSPENKDGSIVKVILGSPAMKEGISLRNTRSVHLLDPYWNKSRTEQIIGRAIRFCSHVGLPKNQRHVDVYHYISNINGQRKTVDQHIMNMSNNKAQLISEFENLLYKAAVDCTLFHNVNGILLKDCEHIDKKLYEAPMFVNEVTKISFDKNGVSTNKEKENMLKKMLDMQVVKVGVGHQRFGFKVTVHAPEKVNFVFINSSLTKMIHNENYKKSKQRYANIQMYMKPVAKKSASMKNINNLSYTHLGFNKGKVTTKKPKIAGGGNGKRNKVPSYLQKCPKVRRPDENGKCPSSFPYLRKKKNGKQCCFKKPTQTKGIIKTNKGKVYIDGKPVNTLKYHQLSKVLKNLGKKLDPMIAKKNMINMIKQL